MTYHYLLDLYNDTINSVANSGGYAGSPTNVTGNYVVRSDVKVNDPTDLNDLLSKKYTSILGASGLFTQIIYDDMLDGTGVNTASSTGVLLGKKGAVGLYPKHGSHTPVLQTTPYGITWSGSGSGPAQAMLTYELFEYVDVDGKTSLYQRQYRDLPADDDVQVEISFNGGTDWTIATDKSLITIVGTEQGTQVVLRFTRTTDIDTRGRVFLGSWAVMF